MSASLDKSQWDALMAKVRQVDKAELDQAVGAVAQRAVDRITQRTPVQTGRLRGSIRSTKQRSADYIVATGVWYAPYVEYRNRNGAMFARSRPEIEADLVSSLQALTRSVGR